MGRGGGGWSVRPESESRSTEGRALSKGELVQSVYKLPVAGKARVWVKGDGVEQYQDQARVGTSTVRCGEHSGLPSEITRWQLLVTKCTPATLRRLAWRDVTVPMIRPARRPAAGFGILGQQK